MRSKDRSITSRKANASETGRPAPSPASRIERRRAVSRRRAKLVGVACLGLCALVLATSFPVSALMRQHRQISTATAELQALTSENESLQLQASALSQPANIAALARRDYNLVRPGQTAYSILPPAGSLKSSPASSGHSSLDQGPVAPGSAQSEALLGDGGPATTASSPGSSGTGSGNAQGQGDATAKSVPGLWSRVLGTLEFWR
ncbi:MAG: FtsB family cell division protein [Acidimicrobiales bacterium]